MGRKTHRYRIKAKVRASFQYDDAYMICKPAEISQKKAENWILQDVDVHLNYGGHDTEKEDIEISNIEISDLGPCP
ncbi:MAG: hypothetical protein JRF35_01905 [Deltaproteobacteria bacterium]|nr:hypothetical protein [Deltaproteobacteria bacterium]MBW2309816.1 hypothetical protein [Deltaproteobacteria bacterium]